MYPANRLRANADFQRVRRAGKSVANGWLVLQWAPVAEPDSLRMGVAVGKKVGNAVVRNRIKRRVRERFRQHIRENRIRSGFDVVLIGRHRASDADYATLARALDELLARANLWRDEPCSEP